MTWKIQLDVPFSGEGDYESTGETEQEAVDLLLGMVARGTKVVEVVSENEWLAENGSSPELEVAAMKALGEI